MSPLRYLGLLILIFLPACGALPRPPSVEQVIPPRIQPYRGQQAVQLELTPVAPSTRQSSSSQSKVRKLTFYRLAREVGEDPLRPSDPWAIKRYRQGRLYHLFFNQAITSPDVPHLIQRSKKTTLSYRSPSDTRPIRKITYMVEAFQLGNGALRRPDTHYGSFGLGSFYRREIIKELEIGIGSISGRIPRGRWPFAPTRIFRDFGGYLESPGLYHQVRFERSTPWGYRVDFDRTGRASLNSRELRLQRN